MPLARTRRAVRRSGSIHGSVHSARRSRRPDTSPAERIASVVSWPLDECLVTPDPDHAGGITVLWIRRHPEEARYVSAVVHADLAGGIEQAWTLIDAGPAATWSMIEDMRDREPLVRTDPAIALSLLARAERAAPECIDPDWNWMSALFRGGRAPFAAFGAAPGLA